MKGDCLQGCSIHSDGINKGWATLQVAGDADVDGLLVLEGGGEGCVYFLAGCLQVIHLNLVNMSYNPNWMYKPENP